MKIFRIHISDEVIIKEAVIFIACLHELYLDTKIFVNHFVPNLGFSDTIKLDDFYYGNLAPNTLFNMSEITADLKKALQVEELIISDRGTIPDSTIDFCLSIEDGSILGLETTDKRLANRAHSLVMKLLEENDDVHEIERND